ncbi:hypothetical protein Syun_020914 [Stephania yunnanensis]|uniref:Uncharacterized protein n=1 Tax=Stephania yunnanensis TaxID=152371 RepID=A0AAP0IF27_9MAGN
MLKTWSSWFHPVLVTTTGLVVIGNLIGIIYFDAFNTHQVFNSMSIVIDNNYRSSNYD